MREKPIVSHGRPTAIICHTCRDLVPVNPQGRIPKLCTSCARAAHRAKMRNRNQTIRADLRDKQAEVRRILDPMRDYLTDDMIRTAEQYIDALEPGAVVDLVTDRAPAGTNTPAGDDIGATTEFEDLDVELERRRVAAIMHDWHIEHPDWWH